MGITKATLVGLLVVGLLAGRLATGLAAESRQIMPGRLTGPCELRIEGQSIVSLTLDGVPGPIERPGSVLHLPAGRYRVSEVVLEDDYRCRPEVLGRRESKPESWFELTPDRPHTLEVGGPLQPTVKVSRQGKYLQFDYDLVDAEGRSYKKPGPTALPSTPPRFVVYQGDQEIDSGTFRYG